MSIKSFVILKNTNISLFRVSLQKIQKNNEKDEANSVCNVISWSPQIVIPLDASERLLVRKE